MLAMLMIEYKLPTSQVPDFAGWKQVFDFMLSIEFPSVDEARSFLDEPMLRRSWDVSGAGQAWLLEETEAVAY
jgi:hypothetical protein